MIGQPHARGGVTDRLGHRVAHPPRGIRSEGRAARPVESLRREQLRHRSGRVQLGGVQFRRVHPGRRHHAQRRPTLEHHQSGRPTLLHSLHTSATTGHTFVAFSPHGHTLAGGNWDSAIYLWDVDDPARPAALGQPLTIPDELSSVAFSPDGRTLASGSDGGGNGYSPGSVQLWDVADPVHPAALGLPLS